MKAKTLGQKFDHFPKIENEESILEKLRDFRTDSIWFNQHYEELKRKYKEEWVAIFHKQVIDHGKSLKILLRRLRKNYPKDAGDMVVEFVTLEEVNLIL
jgi:hypothetical protein